MRCTVCFFCSTGGGGGGGAAVGTEPIMPPITPPGVPPGTPPGTPPTTPALEGGGSSSSLIMAISLGTALGAVSLPASNCRGMTFTIFTGTAAGGGGGGGGGGGAMNMAVNCALGSTSNTAILYKMAPPSTVTWATNVSITVHVRFVFPTPSTNVCSNIAPLFQTASPRLNSPARVLPLFHGSYPTLAYWFLCRAYLRRRRHSGLLTLIEPVVPEQHDRTRHEYGRVRPDYDTHHQRK